MVWGRHWIQSARRLGGSALSRSSGIQPRLFHGTSDCGYPILGWHSCCVYIPSIMRAGIVRSGDGDITGYGHRRTRIEIMAHTASLGASRGAGMAGPVPMAAANVTGLPVCERIPMHPGHVPSAAKSILHRWIHGCGRIYGERRPAAIAPRPERLSGGIHAARGVWRFGKFSSVGMPPPQNPATPVSTPG